MGTLFPDAPLAHPQDPPRVRFGRFRPWLAVLLTLVSAGLGQIFNRQPLKGLLFHGGGICLVLVIGWGDLVHTFPGLVAWLILELAYFLVVLVDAFRTCRSQQRTGLFPTAPRLWYFVALLAMGLALLHFNTDFVLDEALGVRAFRLPADSMKPTLVAGDHLVADMKAFVDSSPQRGELVVFTQPHGTEMWIKRVIGLPGDTVEGDATEIRVNGEPLAEPYILLDSQVEQESPYLFRGRATFGPVAVPEGKLFLAGDNRHHSFDSRFEEFGLVDVSSVKGKPLFIYYSRETSRIGNKLE